MKFIHTADWHLGKLVQGVYMTDDQRFVLQQLIETIERERPDAVVIAGDLYDRAVPPTEAVDLLDELFQKIVIELNTPILAVSGNHDSPDRLNFATKIMEARGLHLVCQMKPDTKPVVLRDQHGEVHFHLIPYVDPAQVRYTYGDEQIRSHDDAMRAVVSRLESALDPQARHVVVGHAFVTPGAVPQENTSQSERPLSVGGADHVHAEYFKSFHYTALGHLHQAHFVSNETIQYAGSPLKYSISEETHRKGFFIVEMDRDGTVHVEKREFKPVRDMRRIIAPIEEIETHPVCEDYVFVTLVNDNPVLFPMEKVRAVYPNALHVERRVALPTGGASLEQGAETGTSRREADPVSLFASFYQEVKGIPLAEDKQKLFAQSYADVLKEEGGAV
ncbi:DNA repair exonuclease [Cohnella kolymensis]|uniref:Nuclease SbcCD subunit D n=1 Tax=Cohnella kolymensis TaxID=1590652 RepID=A0ABR5A4F0_9BACL|nr:exonuclease SbcCD subunit D [Cohnella kolymensis]KIL35603.1 DNA repair exonuclease [Cohnella kolymensis]